MNNIAAVAFLLFLIAACIAAVFSAVILFHLQKYAVPGDRTVQAKRAFFAGNGLFFLLAVIAVIMLIL